MVRVINGDVLITRRAGSCLVGLSISLPVGICNFLRVDVGSLGLNSQTKAPGTPTRTPPYG